MMRRLAILALALGMVSTTPSGAQESRGFTPVPHGQDRMPNAPRSPAEAIAKMKVPEGFSVEVVASEPDIVNPVAMTFDERGRVWITESLEYPRQSAGPGRDRVKILEDTDGDGKADKFTVFAEGLNIPSGIAVGAGGVWVANAPDILFMKDTDGDDKADTREVVVTGFGRDDTHELPNSLTWGPDGRLYGLNGVFNRSVVKHQGKTHEFTCALFRIHPKTRAFDLFAQGTSNPWGVAYDLEGSAFVSACVIDHLWHLSETGYYHRQGGPYPPFTWKIESIVDFLHQKAAYCGIHYFDSDAYPKEYRERLYMGNIHGNCVNVDVLERNGSTYRGKNAPDFLQANDAWFMPVVQKTGPDGCLYVLDWYDRYHCYQDARRDPEGIDRLKGRLYRIRYKGTPRPPRFNLATEPDEKLVDRLASPNVYYRDLARRILKERDSSETRPRLEALVLDPKAERKTRMEAFWTLIGQDRLETSFHLKMLAHPDPGFRAWAVRAGGNFENIHKDVFEKILALRNDSSADVVLQVVIAAPKLLGRESASLLLEILDAQGNDPLIPRIVWQNLHPTLDETAGSLKEFVDRARLSDKRKANFTRILPRFVERLLGAARPKTEEAAAIVAKLVEESSHSDICKEAAGKCLNSLAAGVQSGVLGDSDKANLRERLGPTIARAISADPEGALGFDAAVLAASWNDRDALGSIRSALDSGKLPEARRLPALHVLLASNDPAALDSATLLLAKSGGNSVGIRGQVLDALGKLDDSRVADVAVKLYPSLESELRPRVIELLTQRSNWAKTLLDAVANKTVPAESVNINQVRKLLAGRDPEVVKRVRSVWGTVREERNTQREQVIARVRDMLGRSKGDPAEGAKVFKNLCAQCHKIHGEGQDVGPDVTRNGRASFDQLLSNVLDPSLVIGEAYQATLLETKDGRVLLGLIAEDSPQRVVLRTQGGKLETVARGDVESRKLSPLSVMPESIENQIKTQELIDLFAFLCLDKPPTDASARPIPGTPRSLSSARAGSR